jgi:signal transduction histidine kinase
MTPMDTDLPAATGQRPDWDDLGAVAAWWLRPLSETLTWVALGYLFVGVLAATFWFGLVLSVLAVSYVLAVLYIGVPLTLAAFAFVDWVATLARLRARWIGVNVERRPLRPGSGLWNRFRVQSSDPARWRQVAYHVTSPFVATALFAAAVGAWASTVAAAVTIVVMLLDTGERDLPELVVAGLALPVALGLAPRLVIVLGRAEARWAAFLLGPDPVAVMQQRVDSLSQQRSEILEAVANERHRIERNLHDGAQQRLVALGIDLGLARAKLADDPAAAAALLEDAREKTRTAIGELRVIGRGLHPAILGDRGLDAALSAVVSDSPVPIALNVQPDLDVAFDTQETAYYVVSEAVSNILKHAGARVASVHVLDEAGTLSIVVHDDGCGGADLARGSGLAGIAARVRGADGRFELTSPAGGPTVLRVELPHG